MKKIEVAILDKTYSLVTDESEVVLKEAVELCNKSLLAVLEKSGNSIEKAAILVALQCAVELTKQKNQNEMVDEYVKQILSLCPQS